MKVQTYDAKLRPTCGEIHIPGYIKIASGQIEINEPLHASEDNHLNLELTIEQNSFMVGQVCEKGESRNAFIPNEVCNLDLCHLMGDFCQLLTNKGTFGVDDLPEDYKDVIAIGPVTIPQIEGEWKAEMAITQSGEAKAGIRIESEDSWTSIKLGSDDDIQVYEETERRRKDGTFVHEEL